MSKKKKTAKPKVEASYLSSRIIDQLGHDQVMAWLVSNIKDEIEVLEFDTKTELSKIETGVHRGEYAKEARKYVASMKKVRKQLDKLLKLLNQFSELRAQIDALY